MTGDLKALFPSLNPRLVCPNIVDLTRRSGYSRATWYSVINSGYLTLNADGSIPVDRAQAAMEHYRAFLRARRRAVNIQRREINA